MATASHIELDPATSGVIHAPSITQESCKAASELLQENHEKYHMFFNEDSFHNHIAHHLLTIFALGASPDELQKAFNTNKSHQRPQYPINEENVKAMRDDEEVKNFLGKEKYFHDFEAFFKREIDEKGWQKVLRDSLLARTPRSEDLLYRMFAGFLHPIIHLGFGVEFKQPAIMVEALAQASIHDNWIAALLHGAENAAKAKASKPSKTLNELIHEIRASDKIHNSPHWNDGNKIRDGVLARAKEEMIDLAAQWRVKPEELEKKTAEMINAAVYFTGAAQRPDKMVKFDFFYMHSVNCSVFFSAFLNEDWLKVEDKCRLLEWKTRMDLAMYASRRSPELLLEQITEYKPKRPQDRWKEVMARVNRFSDDGHASKLIRALANGEEKCKKYEDKEDFVISGDMWLTMGHMVIDSVEGEGPHWVRNCGFDKAWENIPDRAKL